jgi:hypothetical protein
MLRVPRGDFGSDTGRSLATTSRDCGQKAGQCGLVVRPLRDLRPIPSPPLHGNAAAAEHKLGPTVLFTQFHDLTLRQSPRFRAIGPSPFADQFSPPTLLLVQSGDSMNLQSLHRGCPAILERLTGQIEDRFYP